MKLGLEDTGVLGQDEGMGRQLIDNTEHSIYQLVTVRVLAIK